MKDEIAKVKQHPIECKLTQMTTLSVELNRGAIQRINDY